MGWQFSEHWVVLSKLLPNPYLGEPPSKRLSRVQSIRRCKKHRLRSGSPQQTSQLVHRDPRLYFLENAQPGDQNCARKPTATIPPRAIRVHLVVENLRGICCAAFPQEL